MESGGPPPHLETTSKMKTRATAHATLALLCLAVFCVQANAEAETTHETRSETRPLSLMKLEFGPHVRCLGPDETWADAKSGTGYAAPPFKVTLFIRGGEVTGGFGSRTRYPRTKPEYGEMEKAVPLAGKKVLIDRDPTSVLTEYLKFENDTLTGRIGLDHPWYLREFEVIATNVNGVVTGSFTFPKAKKAGVRWSVTGTYIHGDKLEELKGTQALNPKAQWPHWKGPTYDGRVSQPDPDLVDSLEDAQLVWCSEVQLPGGGAGQSIGWSPGAMVGDYNGPLVADGRVIFATIERSAASPPWPGYTALPDPKASGRRPTLQRKLNKLGWDKRSQALRDHIDNVTAFIMDDAVHAMDAATGATLWKTRLHARGLSGSMTGKGKGGLWSTGVLREGKFWFMGSSGWLYCLDAATGRLIWESKEANPNRIAAFEKGLARLKSGEIDLAGLQDANWGPGQQKVLAQLGNPSQVQRSLCIADGILLCEMDGGLGAVDAATGKRLWGPVKGCLITNGSPAPWVHQGTTYVMTGMALLELKTGKVRWNNKKGGRQGVCDAVTCGDIMVLNGSKWSKEAMHAYRITPDKCEPLWTMKEMIAPSFTHPTIDPATRRIYVKDGHGSHCVIELDTGKLLGQERFANKLWGGQILAMNGARLFHGTNGGHMVKVAPDGKLELLGVINAPQHCCITPALADGRWFIRTLRSAQIACYDLRKKN